MKRLNLFLGGLVAMAFSACTNEDLQQEGNANLPEAEQITVTAYTAGTNSSSRVDQEINGNTITLIWSNGDAFSVIRGGGNATFIKTTTEGAGANDFIGTLPGTSGTCYAVYPATENTATNHEVVPFDISNQTGADAYLMYAVSEDGATYQFNHAVAYLKATFPADLKGEEVTITITTPSGVYTDGNIDLTNGALSGGSNNTITKIVTFDNNSTEVWFALPPMVATNKTLQFNVEITDGQEYTATLEGTEDRPIEAGMYYSATIDNLEVHVKTLCELPIGYSDNTNDKTFNKALKGVITDNITSIVFEASNKNIPVEARQIYDTGAYTYVDGNILYVSTAADEFVFHANSRKMFYNFKKIQTINFGENIINTVNVTNMSEMFNNCQALTTLDLRSFNTANVTNMSKMFTSCQALTTLDLSSFNTANVTSMDEMFYGCQALTTLDLSSFNTANVTNMSNMFRFCLALTTLDLSSFNTANVTSMDNMFNCCYLLTELDLSSFNTANVTNMEYMFYGCKALTELNLSHFNTANVTNMQYMFNSCKALTELDLRSFNTAIVTNMCFMFNGCNALTKLDLSSNFNTEKVTNMKYMFSDCNVLTKLDLSSFNTANVTDMSFMFSGCPALTELNLSSFNTMKVSNMLSMFNNCKKLQSLDLTNFSFTANGLTVVNMFQLTGETSGASTPIAIKVTLQGYDFLTADGSSTSIGSYAKYVLSNESIISDYEDGGEL